MDNELKESSYVSPEVGVILLTPSRVLCDSDPVVGDPEEEW